MPSHRLYKNTRSLEDPVAIIIIFGGDWFFFFLAILWLFFGGEETWKKINKFSVKCVFYPLKKFHPNEK